MAKRIVVIGGGPGGHAAAVRAADLGARVTLVERAELGGTCLNRGCVPTKVFLEAARLLRGLERSSSLGIDAETSFEMARLVGAKREIVSRLKKSLEKTLESRGVELVRGEAKVETPNMVVVESGGDRIKFEADDIVIATGSRPASPSGWDKLSTTDEIFDDEELPESIGIIGGGTTGAELANIFCGLGSEVVLLEAMERILPDADPEVSSTSRRILERAGVEVHCRARVEDISPRNNGHRISLVVGKTPMEIDVERVLTTTGRAPNSQSLFPQELGPEIDDNGWITVDAQMRTSLDNIYAVGDVTGGELCAHSANAQGIAAAENIMGAEPTIRHELIPSYVSTIPEIAWVGMTEEEARAAGRELLVGKFPALANPRSSVAGYTEGFAKILADGQTGEVLGVHLITDHAADISMEVALAMSAELLLEDIASAAHPHPCYSEILSEAARIALGESVQL